MRALLFKLLIAKPMVSLLILLVNFSLPKVVRKKVLEYGEFKTSGT
jgi:hypothetical protein